MTRVSQPPVLGVLVKVSTSILRGDLECCGGCQTALDVGENMTKLSLGLGQSYRAERDVLASAGSGEPQP
jgi:hypothetical protein